MTINSKEQDLWLLQELLNSNLEIGSRFAKKSDLAIMFGIEPDWEFIQKSLKRWEDNGFIKIISDIDLSRYKDFVVEVLQPITAIIPPDSQQ